MVSTGDRGRVLKTFSFEGGGETFNGETSHSSHHQTTLAIPLGPSHFSYLKLLFRFDLLCVTLDLYP